MAFPSHARKRASRVLFLLSLSSMLAACGPSAPPVDLESEPQGTDRERLRAAMAEERPIFFEIRDGERFYSQVKRTAPHGFELSEKEPFDGENPIPMTERVIYAYEEVLRAEPIPEEANSSRGLAVGTVVILAAALVLVLLPLPFP